MFFLISTGSPEKKLPPRFEPSVLPFAHALSSPLDHQPLKLRSVYTNMLFTLPKFFYLRRNKKQFSQGFELSTCLLQNIYPSPLDHQLFSSLMIIVILPKSFLQGHNEKHFPRFNCSETIVFTTGPLTLRQRKHLLYDVFYFGVNLFFRCHNRKLFSRDLYHRLMCLRRHCLYH